MAEVDELENSVQARRAYRIELEQKSLASEPVIETVVVIGGWTIKDGALVFYGEDSEIVYNWSKVILFQRVEDVELSTDEDVLDFMEGL